MVKLSNLKSFILLRLKRLQVIDLVENRGTFMKLNFTIPTDDFLDVINEFYKGIFEDFINFVFLYNAQTHASEIITVYGLCYTFNLALHNDLVNTNTTSNDFHHDLFAPGFYVSPPLPPEDYPEKDSSFPYGLKVELTISHKLAEMAYKKNFIGNYIFLHDPFELPSSSSTKFLLTPNRKVSIKIIPQINLIDDSITEYDPVE